MSIFSSRLLNMSESDQAAAAPVVGAKAKSKKPDKPIYSPRSRQQSYSIAKSDSATDVAWEESSKGSAYPLTPKPEVKSTADSTSEVAGMLSKVALQEETPKVADAAVAKPVSPKGHANPLPVRERPTKQKQISTYSAADRHKAAPANRKIVEDARPAARPPTMQGKDRESEDFDAKAKELDPRADTVNANQRHARIFKPSVSQQHQSRSGDAKWNSFDEKPFLSPPQFEERPFIESQRNTFQPKPYSSPRQPEGRSFPDAQRDAFEENSFPVVGKWVAPPSSTSGRRNSLEDRRHPQQHFSTDRRQDNFSARGGGASGKSFLRNRPNRMELSGGIDDSRRSVDQIIPDDPSPRILEHDNSARRNSADHRAADHFAFPRGQAGNRAQFGDYQDVRLNGDYRSNQRSRQDSFSSYTSPPRSEYSRKLEPKEDYHPHQRNRQENFSGSAEPSRNERNNRKPEAQQYSAPPSRQPQQNVRQDGGGQRAQRQEPPRRGGGARNVDPSSNNPIAPRGSVGEARGEFAGNKKKPKKRKNNNRNNQQVQSVPEAPPEEEEEAIGTNVSLVFASSKAKDAERISRNWKDDYAEYARETRSPTVDKARSERQSTEEKPPVDQEEPTSSAGKEPLANVFAITKVGDWSFEVEQHEEQLRKEEAERKKAKEKALETTLKTLNSAFVSEKPSASASLAATGHKGGLITLPANVRVSSDGVKEAEPKRRQRDIEHALHSLMEDLGRLEHQFHLLALDYSQRGIPEDTSYFLQLRAQIHQNYSKLLLSECFQEACNQHQLDANLWKGVYYEMIEAIRRLMDAVSNIGPLADKAHGFLLKFIEEAVDFYQSILEEFERTYGFQFADYIQLLDEHLSRPLRPFGAANKRSVKLALIISQRLMIALGDLARYKELALKTCNFGRSRSWYLKASQLSPKNGRPYNQLGLLAMYTHRRMDAVYFLVKSLAARTPFEMAMQPLITTFADVQRKFAQFENAVRCELEAEKKKQGHRERTSSDHRNRIEMWIRPDGSKDQRDCVAEDDVEAQLTDLSILCRTKTDLLHRRMTTYFLQLSSMLIQKLNMEMFDSIAEKVLVQLRELLSRTQSPLTAVELVQFVSIALYCVHNSTPKTASKDKDTHSLLTQCALQFLFSLFGILLESLSKILAPVKTFAKLAESLQDDARLPLILPAVRVVSNWIMLSRARYMDVANSFGGVQTDRFNTETWRTLASICNRLAEPEIHSVRIVTSEKEEKDLTSAFVIPEDSFMAGFSEMFQSPSPIYVGEGIPLPIACHSHRLYTLTELADYLDGIRFPFISYDPKLRCYASPSLSEFPAPSVATLGGGGSAQSAGQWLPENASGSRRLNTSLESDEFTPEFRQFHDQRQSEHQKRELLSQVGGAHQTFLEIAPSILVADTNTFIDHLPLLNQILESTKYWLYVCSPVKAELEGLTKRKDSDWVPKMAREALRLLGEATDKGKLKLKGITTLGAVVDDLRYLNENFTDSTMPDDRILKCCEHIVKSSQQQVERVDLKTEALRLRRNVVLLTDDRNLRLKAILRDVPTRTVPRFVKWARLSSS